MKSVIRPIFKVGMSAMEVVVEVVRVNPKIRFLSFYDYAPFLNSSELEKPELSRLLFHDQTRETIRLNRKKITVHDLGRIINSLGEGKVIGLISKIKIQDKYSHIPLMDFSCRNSSENLNKISQFLKEIGQSQGAILSSGRSYHYYGASLMNEKEWIRFLGNCGLSSLVDKRYLFHRLKDQCGILRISACKLRPTIPTVALIL